MPTIASEVVDWLTSQPNATANDKALALKSVPSHQWALEGGYWSDLAPHCFNRIEVKREIKFMNRLAINVMTPLPRCLYLSPDGRGLAWLKSGGEIEAYG